MAYIVDLMAILEGLFVLSRDGRNGFKPLTRQLVKSTIDAYDDSVKKGQAHRAIKLFVGRGRNIFDREEVLDKLDHILRDDRWEPDPNDFSTSPASLPLPQAHGGPVKDDDEDGDGDNDNGNGTDGGDGSSGEEDKADDDTDGANGSGESSSVGDGETVS